MANTYVKYTIEGEHTVEAAQRKLGDVAASGAIVRIDVGGGNTHVYIAEHGGAGPGGSRSESGLKGQIVSEADVVRLG